MNRWQEVSRIARENGETRCRVVNSEGKKDPRCTGKFEESHHGIWGAQKHGKTDKEWRMFLDSPYNHAASCHACNVSRVGDGSEARYQFFLLQVKKYTKSQMKNWLAGAPALIKDRHEWRRYWNLCSENDIMRGASRGVGTPTSSKPNEVAQHAKE